MFYQFRAMAPHLSSFRIVHRDTKGTPDSIYPRTGRLHACVETCINVCRKMLRYVKVRSALASFAGEFDHRTPKAWFWDPRFGYRSYDELVTTFLKIISSEFPTLYVDDSLDHPGFLGVHIRREWDDNFEPHNQSILMNGPVCEKVERPRSGY